MAVYGIVAYDIKTLKGKNGEDVVREASAAVPAGMRKLGWISSTKSVWTGDYSRHDEVMHLLRKYLDHPEDVVFPMARFDERDEKSVQTWVRIAMTKFFDEVVSSVKKSVDGFMARLDTDEEDKLGVSDVTDRMTATMQRARNKIEDAMIALTTFRLSGEFKDFREAKIAETDAIFLENLGKLMNRQPVAAAAATSEKTD